MKKNIMAAAMMLSALAGSEVAAQAADGTINFTGEVLDAACTVDVGSSSPLTVDLGKVQKSAFSGDGTTADATKFTLKLSACPDTLTSAVVRFDGTPYSGDESVLALTTDDGVATGVGIQLTDASDKVVSLDTGSSAYPLVKGSVNSLDFYARYIQKGTTVTAGSANATTGFTISYE